VGKSSNHYSSNDHEINRQLQQANRILKAIRNINQLITRTENRDTLLQGACDCLTATMGFYNVWIALFSEDRELVSYYQSGLDEKFEPMSEKLRDGKLPQCFISAMDQDHCVVTEDPATACSDCPLSGFYERRAGMAVRIKHNKSIYGVLSVSIPVSFSHDQEVKELLSELAGDLGYALHQLETNQQYALSQETLSIYSSIISNTENPMTYIDSNYRLIEVNDAFAQYYGDPKEKLIGKTLRELEGDHLFKEKIKPFVDSCLQGEEVYLDYHASFPGKGDRWVSIHFWPHKSQDEKITGVFAIGRDITEYKNKELEAQAILRTTCDGFWKVNPQGRILEANQAAAQMLGYTQEEILKLTIRDIDVAQTAKQIENNIEEIREKGYKLFESQHQHKQGHLIDVEVSTTFLPQYGDQFIVFIRDITLRKQHQANLNNIAWLLEHEDLLKSSSRKTVYGDVTELNEERTIMDSVGKEVLNALSEDIMALLDTSFAVYEKNGDYAFGSFVSEWCWLMDNSSRNLCQTKDNREALDCGRWLCHENCWNDSAKAAMEAGGATDIGCVGGIRLYGVPIKAGNEIIGAMNIGYGNPPTDEKTLSKLTKLFNCDPEALRKAALAFKPRPPFLIEIAKKRLQSIAVQIGKTVEAAQYANQLNDLEKRNRALLDHSPVCHKIVDQDFNLQYMNKSGFEMLKLIPSEKIYGKPYPFDFFPQASRNKMITEIKNVFNSGKTTTFEDLACDIEGNEVWLFHTLVPVFKKDGTIDYLTVVSADTTERTKMQKRLQQSEKMEAIGLLAGGIAHDFNNVLAGIIGFADMSLDEVQENSSIAEYIQQILKASSRAKNLVKQILTFSRQSHEEKNPLYLKPILTETIQLLRASLPSTIEIKSKIYPDSKPVLGNSDKLHEVIINLCTNAAYAMNEKGVLEIELREKNILNELQGAISTIEPGLYSVISIRDDGCGMDKELISHIFEPFYTTKPVGSGTGMGLAVVIGIIQVHHGDIKVISEKGKGTEFVIYLPKTDKDLFSEEQDEEEIPFGNESVMFIDDEDLLCSLAQSMLTSLGYKVTTFNDSLKALKSFRQFPDQYDLIITDQTMPALTGIELVKEILSIRPGLPIILCTGFSKSVDKTQCEKAGVKSFCLKPLRKKEIAVKMREILDKAKSI